MIAANYVAVKVNADHFPAVAQRFNVTGLPTTIITTPQGQIVDSMRGRIETGVYATRLTQVAGQFQSTSRRDGRSNSSRRSARRNVARHRRRHCPKSELDHAAAVRRNANEQRRTIARRQHTAAGPRDSADGGPARNKQPADAGRRPLRRLLPSNPGRHPHADRPAVGDATETP